MAKRMKNAGRKTLAELVQLMGEAGVVNAVDKYLRARERVRKCDAARRAAAGE